MIDQTESPIFTDDEQAQINEMRVAYASLTERDKFVVREALRVFFKIGK